MNELFDKLILRIVFTGFMCLILFLYKYAHRFLYPSSREQMFKRFFPSKNSPDTLHLFSRLIGISVLFSEFHFDLDERLPIALSMFAIQATLTCFIYLASIYIIESIVLYNFEYSDEILKRKSFPYAIISFAHSIGIAYILKIVLAVSNNSLILLLFLWLFSLVILGFATKTFSILSKLNFNRLLVQKSMTLAFSYTGFIWGWTLIIASALNHQVVDIRWYGIQVILKILLALIILPIFRRSLIWIFKIQDDFDPELKGESNQNTQEVDFGYGVFEGSIFFTCCFLTTVITGNINFGTFYPIY
ncbi:MAG: hypothetical protein HN509_18330 [Halobacteriovoraceae bacterium]|jgi:hypothetical protein|nr:hypothetical protein [Halobacteriovoraceae bacterium]MBT5093533.1 hypothetical protein [Halobacteriovoraceae bacterium]